MAKITLCMIVRDEQELLPACLQSVQGVVDEMVIVDTGSNDDTRAIASAAGAKVVDFVWCDDFAAARNAALAHVSGDYILMLDADERLAKGARPKLEEAIAEGIDLGLIALHNAASFEASHEQVLSGKARLGQSHALSRFFRFTPDFAWTGVVHEDNGPWVRAAERKVGLVAADIVHYGDVPSYREQLAKPQRNLALLEKRCQREPENAGMRCYLLRELLRVAQSGVPDALAYVQRAHVEGDRAWQTMVDYVAEYKAKTGKAGVPQGGPSVVMVASMVGYMRLDKGDIDGALEVVECAREWVSQDHANLELLFGTAHERKALKNDNIEQQRLLWTLAKEAYVKCISMHGTPVTDELMDGATSHVAWTRLGTVLLLEDEFENAQKCFERALRSQDDFIEARLGQVEAVLRQRQVRWALKLLEPLLEDDETVDAIILLAAIQRELGDQEGFHAALRKSLQVKNPALRARHRKPLWLALSEEMMAELDQARSQALGIPASPDQAQQVSSEMNARGEEAFFKGEVQQADELFRQAIEVNGHNAEAWNNLGVSLHLQGKSKEALKAFEQGMIHEPGHRDSLVNAAIVLRCMERTEEGMLLLQEVLQKNPEDAEASKLMVEMGAG